MITGLPVEPLSIPSESLTAKSSEANIARRFEQMLWAEMLSHSGLEEALTKNGGEAASAFSRMVVESIAADIAAKHPLGLSAAATQSAKEALE